MYKYLFGPVPSRRLGISLGVDLVPHKTCTLDCIYCECGETTNLTMERKEYVPVDQVLKELENYFKNNPDPDYITFSGSGEPTLNIKIGEVLDFIKQKKPHISIAVLTNGTLLGLEDVRKDLLGADLVMPSLDGASIAALHTLNRPHDSIDIESYINGLALFRSEFTGIFNLEIFILPGCNDSQEEIALMKKAIQRINPDLVQLNTLDRPGVVADISTASLQDLQKIAEFLQPIKTEIIASAPQRKAVSSYQGDMESAIRETITRRPCTLEDLATFLGTHINEINKYLGALEEAGDIESVRGDRGIFYQSRNKFTE
ncbi:radical SAM protein [Desulforhopalus sp. 52FAK]